MKKRRREIARRASLISYISSVPNGVEADAVLLGLTDTVNRAGYNPLFEFVMRVLPEESAPFETRFQRVVPAGIVPNLQLGRKFRVIYDPSDRSQVSFLYFTGENGETFDFRHFPVRWRKIGETEMKPDEV